MKGTRIRLLLSADERPVQAAPPPPPPPAPGPAPATGTAPGAAADSRIFFTPRPSALHQVLGVDFAPLDKGQTRLRVTMDRLAPYQLQRQGPKVVALRLEKTTIPELLQRHLDTTHFEGAVDQVKPEYSAEDKRLSLHIRLREMVPFHLDQDEKSIFIDFETSAVRPPELTPVPVRTAAPGTPELRAKAAPVPPVSDGKAAPPEPAAGQSAAGAAATAIPGLARKNYSGKPMSMDFVDAEVTNILRLIGEMSNLNIVWSPEVKGKVSMRLKSVPWDQALDLVLTNNDLAMRHQGNVIWVTSRAHLVQIEEEERQRREAAEADKKKRLEEAQQAKELEPLATAYFPLDFAKALEIKDHILLSARGKISVDERTNTIIIKDIASNLEEARQIVARFDTPVKQILIEARIVDASTDFSRELGVKWNSISRKWRDRTGQDFSQTDPTQFARPGDLTAGGSFSTNSPGGWVGNVGLNFARLTDGGLGTLALDATLALAEAEGKVKIISAPKVIASNGEQAVISRGDILYKDIVTAERVDTREIAATLSLTVTPNVSFNDYVTMEIEVTDDKAITENQKLEKRIKTKLMVKSGETLVIGGIFKEDQVSDEEGVPLLKNVPLLGWLFKAQTKSKEKSELLIFLTPRVVETTPRGT